MSHYFEKGKRVNHLGRSIGWVMTGLYILFVGCSPSSSQFKKILEEKPEILFSVIEKHPDEFMAVVQKALGNAQKKGQEAALKEEQEQREKEFKNPVVAEVSEDRAIRGDKGAPITIVEYSDFQCPFCARGFQTMQQVFAKYGGKVRLIYKHLPLPMHSMAIPAAERFEAISLQSSDKAYQFHDEIFKHQEKLGSNGEKFMDGIAQKIGVNVAKMKTDMKSQRVKDRIEADTTEAQKFGFSGTPGFLVAGVSIRGAYPLPAFQEIIDKKLGGK